jgi:hypothetical protein
LIDDLLVLLLHHDNVTAVRLLHLFHLFTGDIAKLPPLLSILSQMKPQALYYHRMSEGSKLCELHILFRGVCVVVNISNSEAITDSPSC